MGAAWPLVGADEPLPLETGSPVLSLGRRPRGAVRPEGELLDRPVAALLVVLAPPPVPQPTSILTEGGGEAEGEGADRVP